MMSVMAVMLALCLQANDASARDALKKLSGRFKDLRTLSCNVTQSRTTMLLDKPITSSGHLYYRREPGKLVFNMTKPRRTELHFDSKTYQVYRPEEKRLERITFSSGQVSTYLLMVFDPKPGELEKKFTITEGKVVDATIEVRLNPIDDKIRKQLTKLTLVIEQATGDLRSVSYSDRDGDDIRFDLSKIKLNPKLKPNIFKLTVPADTTILNQKMDPGK